MPPVDAFLPRRLSKTNTSGWHIKGAPWLEGGRAGSDREESRGALVLAQRNLFSPDALGKSSAHRIADITGRINHTAFFSLSLYLYLTLSLPLSLHLSLSISLSLLWGTQTKDNRSADIQDRKSVV